MGDRTNGHHPLDAIVAERFCGLDWDDMRAVDRATAPVLDQLATHPQRMIDAMGHALTDPALFARSESDHFFDRAVLFEDYGRGCSIRLQRLHPEDYDRPHNHRATFATCVLAGGYDHTIYAAPPDLDRRTTPVPMAPDEVDAMAPLVERFEAPGATYAIHHSCVHATSPRPGHLSILVRGPSAKDRLFFVDDARGGAYWHWGSKFEDPADVDARLMPEARMLEMISRVAAL
jgi:hypothetical protein